MSITIPFSVSNGIKDCCIELRDLAEGRVVTEIFHAPCPPGLHSVEFDPENVEGGLDAGLYVLYVKIGEEAESYPVQYFP